MRLTDWLMSFVIIIIFSGIAVYSLITRRYDDIKKEWPKYRCNPIMIPLAGQFGEDPFDTFSSCVVGTSSDFVNSALSPITQGVGSWVRVAKKQEKSQNNARYGSFSLRAAFSRISSGLFGMIFSFSTELSRIMMKFKDTINKITGVLATMIHVMDTSINSLRSIWNGPPGQTLRFVSGLCFHENTLLKMYNGNMKKIRDVEIGDILNDGSQVFATMVILNKKSNKYLSDMYMFKGGGEDGEDILVSGSHLILEDKEKQIWTYVKDHKDSFLIEENFDRLNCLITDSHNIQIGKYVFGDWEDNGELPSEIKYVQKKIKHNI